MNKIVQLDKEILISADMNKFFDSVTYKKEKIVLNLMQKKMILACFEPKEKIQYFNSARQTGKTMGIALCIKLGRDYLGKDFNLDDCLNEEFRRHIETMIENIEFLYDGDISSIFPKSSNSIRFIDDFEFFGDKKEVIDYIVEGEKNASNRYILASTDNEHASDLLKGFLGGISNMTEKYY